MASGSKRFSDLQRLSFAEKLAYLRQLSEHRMAQGSEAPRKFDVGTRRPWTDWAYRGMASYVHPSIEFLLDELAEGKEPIDIAFLARREYADTLAMCRIARWMEREVENVPHLTEEQQQAQQERKEQVLVGLGEGLTVKQAAKAAGVDGSTVFDWKRTDPEFAKRYQETMGGRVGSGRWKTKKADKAAGGERASPDPGGYVIPAVLQETVSMKLEGVKAIKGESGVVTETYIKRSSVRKRLLDIVNAGEPHEGIGPSLGRTTHALLKYIRELEGE